MPKSKSLHSSEFCFDTGAGDCYISPKIDDQLGASWEKTNLAIVHTGGEEIKIIGITDIRVFIGKVEFLFNFLIAVGLPIDGLLGNSFISRLITSIQFGAKCTTSKKGKQKFKYP